jgi:diguanylate cyclase (GGDEF)-like protein
VNANGDLIGVITYGDLLAELRRSADPLTDLPWSDNLQEWAIQQLRDGHEITVLFIDVNDFGLFNKRYGHVIGDTVLRSVAGVLRRLTTPELDSLCRYGGDEFCIATLRRADQAAALAERIMAEIADLQAEETSERGISVAVGIRGGRRSKEREHTHYASTLNNLINLASKDCTQKKVKRTYEGDLFQAAEADIAAQQRRTGQPVPDGALPARMGRSLSMDCDRLRLCAVDVRWEDTAAHVKVELESLRSPERIHDSAGHALPGGLGPTAFVSELTRHTDADGVLSLVAEATVEALRRAMPPGYDLSLEDVLSIETNSGRRLVTVTGLFTSPQYRHRVAGTVLADGDVNRAAAGAVLRAASRHLESVPSAEIEPVER